MARSKGGAAASGFWGWLGLAVVIILADQITKLMILSRFQLGDALMVTPWLDIVRAHNKGAAFSMLADQPGWQRWFFISLGVVASGFIVWMLRRHPGQKLFCLAVSLILGGALGNVIDRALHGYVVDFIAVHFNFLAPLFPGGYFPAFNVADSAITLGAVGLILDEVLRVKGSKP